MKGTSDAIRPSYHWTHKVNFKITFDLNETSNIIYQYSACFADIIYMISNDIDGDDNLEWCQNAAKSDYSICDDV